GVGLGQVRVAEAQHEPISAGRSARSQPRILPAVNRDGSELEAIQRVADPADHPPEYAMLHAGLSQRAVTKEPGRFVRAQLTMLSGGGGPMAALASANMREARCQTSR